MRGAWEETMGFEFDENYESNVKIKVVGVGGGGNNAVNRMIASNLRGAEFIAINTDKQALLRSTAEVKIPIGERVTKGHGAGAKPQVGTEAAEESLDEIREAIKGADMIFLTAGMGGGTGTGAAAVIAKAAKELGILTIGFVTKPFGFEGRHRMEQAMEGIGRLAEYVDSLIIIPNEKLKDASETKITLLNAFDMADDVLRRGVQSISDLINLPGFVSLDYADVFAVMHEAGLAHMGSGEGTGADKARIAAKAAITSPLLERPISGAKGMLINITASPDISLEDIDTASQLVADEADPDANIIWGALIDPKMEDAMRITIIATGFGE